LLDFIIKYGRVKAVILNTVIAIIISLTLTELLFYITGTEVQTLGLAIAFFFPASIGPLFSWRLIGLILRIHQLESEMRKLATYDALTSVMSRSAFLDQSESIYHIVKRNKSSLGLIYIDIDDFKKINDTYGHTAGDTVLKSFGLILKKYSRESDLVGRLGGEEFAITLPDTDSPGAVHLAEKIREAARETSIDYSGKTICYTISVGVSAADTQNQVDLDTLISQADSALYKAKNSGKNRVIEYER
jgi:diguanylate cyclase (GGDEF)-like protein